MTNEAIPNLTAPALTGGRARQGVCLAGGAGARRRRSTRAAVEAFRLEWLGRKQGLLNEVSDRWLKAAPAEAKKAWACASKRSRNWWRGCWMRRGRRAAADAALKAEAIDITLPGTRRLTGAEHPITRTMNEIVSVFAALGYSVGVGPEVETDYYNFESMNFPPGPSGARHAGHAGGCRGRSASRCATDCSCARTLRRCRCGRWSSSRRRCAS
jgi:phenylalanyl-tRNA synthetase alpha chain